MQRDKEEGEEAEVEVEVGEGLETSKIIFMPFKI
jgi:hypothetical protein